MTIKQISIFLENKSGRLAEVLAILGEAQIKIYALTIADTSEYGILRLIVNDHKKAVEYLKKHEFTANLTDILAVSIPNTADMYANILQKFAGDAISIEYMYAFGLGNKAALILRPENVESALQALKKHNLTLFCIEDFSSI